MKSCTLYSFDLFFAASSNNELYKASSNRSLLPFTQKNAILP